MSASRPGANRLAFALGGIAALILILALAWLARRSEPVSSTANPAVATDATAPLAIVTPKPSASPAAAASPGPSSRPMTERAARQLRILDQILASRNDNDPRLDSELRNLDETAKAALRDKYRELPHEKRNELGTIVFLLGRNLTTAGDYAFMREVVSEAPCLSPLDCSKEMPADIAGDSGHETNGLAVVLNYPQLNALRAVHQSMGQGSGQPPALLAAAREAMSAGKQSRAGLVARYAAKLDAADASK